MYQLSAQPRPAGGAARPGVRPHPARLAVARHEWRRSRAPAAHELRFCRAYHFPDQPGPGKRPGARPAGRRRRLHRKAHATRRIAGARGGPVAPQPGRPARLSAVLGRRLSHRSQRALHRPRRAGRTVAAQGIRTRAVVFRNIGRLLSRDVLAESVWNREIPATSRTLDTHLSNIRQKLQLRPQNGVRLSSSYALGYRLELVSDPQPQADDAKDD